MELRFQASTICRAIWIYSSLQLGLGQPLFLCFGTCIEITFHRLPSTSYKIEASSIDLTWRLDNSPWPLRLTVRLTLRRSFVLISRNGTTLLGATQRCILKIWVSCITHVRTLATQWSPIYWIDKIIQILFLYFWTPYSFYWSHNHLSGGVHCHFREHLWGNEVSERPQQERSDDLWD